eukprot:TRINITY_DN6898_c0_g1_i1.p1 TRINITY_DN6898_c0_g1~~TRINITY_DN6898_c0_g1_i1.p1  ORF type:complete len:529 (-),score=114.15 TRINITY_DN6898_c0_g1_i1:145-1731(-)
MGRSKQFKKDRLYITQTEWIESFGGKKKDKEKRPNKNLQFYCCNISLQPWTDPVCTPEGVIFDLVSVLPWIKKYKVNPVTGEPMSVADLISLKFVKNDEGHFICPATQQVFTDHTHIVAIKPTGNVYSFKAVDTLNLKNKNFTDICTGEPFKRKDIIVLQDPQHPEFHDSKEYYFVKNNLTSRKKEVMSSDPLSHITLTSTSERIFKEIKEKDEAEKALREEASKLEGSSIVAITDTTTAATPKYRGLDSASFTSTDFTPKQIVDEGWKPKSTPLKGYVRIVTNRGNINLQLHCDLVPLTTENFLTHCCNGYYNGTIFHRNIRHFVIQGGDPTGTGKGGESIWGKPFPDEFHKSLKHDGEGVLSMANRGKNTNTSQFFIMYKSAPHLNGVHSVFGKVVGGLEILRELSHVETDESDRPLEEIKILETIVYKNPFDDAEMKKQEIIQQEKQKREKESKEYGAWLSNPTAALAPHKEQNQNQTTEGIGKYITTTTPQNKKHGLDFGTISQPPAKKKKTDRSGYGDFSNFG